jgi:hypothetical protein
MLNLLIYYKYQNRFSLHSIIPKRPRILAHGSTSSTQQIAL